VRGFRRELSFVPTDSGTLALSIAGQKASCARLTTDLYRKRPRQKKASPEVRRWGRAASDRVVRRKRLRGGLASSRYGFLNDALRPVNWIVLVQRRKRSSWEGIETCVSGREESSTGLKVFASVLKWPRGYTSGAVCPRARLIAESEAKSGGVKISNQPMCLSEKFACGETFHNAHRGLAARTRVAGCSGTFRGESRNRKIQQLPA